MAFTEFEHFPQLNLTVTTEKIFYHVLRVFVKLVARHLAKVVHLQATWLMCNIIIRVVGPDG